MTSNLRFAEARDLIGAGFLDGQRLPLIEFMDAQQAEIERLDGLWRTEKARADFNFEENERLRTALTACQTYDYRQIIEESDRLRAALERIANPDGRFEGEGECEAIARKCLGIETGLKP